MSHDVTGAVYAVEYRVTMNPWVTDPNRWLPSGEDRIPTLELARLTASRMHADADAGIGFETRILRIISTVVES